MRKMDRMDRLVLQRVLNVVFEDPRVMVAGSPITESDRHEMTSEVRKLLKEHVEAVTYLTNEEAQVLIEAGKKVMFGAYILEQDGYFSLIDELYKIIIDNTRFTNLHLLVVKDPRFYHRDRYYESCALFGLKKKRG
jgi:hypothetical protein